MLLPDLLHAPVLVEELFHDPPGARLFPEEAALVAGAVGERRREFATVRLCARTALGRLGIAPAPIVPATGAPGWAGRAPRWPDGVAGSMTHCPGYRAAAVAPRTSVASLGIDAEPDEPLRPGVARYALRPEERIAVRHLLAVRPEVAWDRLICSAKESVYKAWYPLTGTWLDFKECRLLPDPENGTFTAEPLVPGPLVGGARLDHFTGRWRSLDTHGRRLLVTAVVVPGPVG